ncbi:MAG: hypothetical protein GY702_05510, partial [Desulfobulbaceae bacterium]|nr:hypothetical protein [Desulfobulbaceae bacterium]
MGEIVDLDADRDAVVVDMAGANVDKRVVIIDPNKVSKNYPTVDHVSLQFSDPYDLAYSINPSPIKWHRFVPWLHDYDSSKFHELAEMICYGVSIPSAKVFDPHAPVPPNQKSTQVYADQVQIMICEELLANRIAGPFTKPPYGLIVSPLGAVPKKDSHKIRIIHNLSYPYSDSVNSHIPREYCQVEYELIEVCVSLVATIGRGCL